MSIEVSTSFETVNIISFEGSFSLGFFVTLQYKVKLHRILILASLRPPRDERESRSDRDREKGDRR